MSLMALASDKREVSNVLSVELCSSAESTVRGLEEDTRAPSRILESAKTDLAMATSLDLNCDDL